MTDIVERLRVRRYSRSGETEMITLEAAAEIERLRAALDSTDAAKTLWKNKAKQHLSHIEHLEAALRLFACDCIESSNLCPSPQNCRNYIARAALEEGRT